MDERRCTGILLTFNQTHVLHPAAGGGTDRTIASLISSKSLILLVLQAVLIIQGIVRRDIETDICVF